jgi:hypothetical protein
MHACHRVDRPKNRGDGRSHNDFWKYQGAALLARSRSKRTVYIDHGRPLSILLQLQLTGRARGCVLILSGGPNLLKQIARLLPAVQTGRSRKIIIIEAELRTAKGREIGIDAAFRNPAFFWDDDNKANPDS